MHLKNFVYIGFNSKRAYYHIYFFEFNFLSYRKQQYAQSLQLKGARKVTLVNTTQIIIWGHSEGSANFYAMTTFLPSFLHNMAKY